MKNIIIRELNEIDLEQALELWKEAFNAGFSSNFDSLDVLIKYLNRNPNMSSVAYKENGELVGALLCGHDGRRGSIYHTAVKPEYRGLGIGKQLEQRALEKLREEGIHTAFLFINIKNPGSKEL